MDINQLEAFVHVVRLGSYSKAARHLNLSQPTISIRVQGIEKVMGGSLFQRAGKGVELTDIGKGFLPYALQMIDVLSRGIDRVKSIQEGKVVHVTIGTLPTFTSGAFSSIISQLHRSSTDIQVEIHTGHNEQLFEMLFDGFIKIGLITFPYFNTEIKHHAVLKEPLILVAHRDHPIAVTHDRTVSELVKECSPYIIVDWSEESKHWQKSMITPGLNHLELPPSTALDFVLSNNGITLVTESMVQDLLDNNTLVKLNPIDFPQMYRQIALVSLDSEDLLSPAVRTFIDLFRVRSDG
ncbi:LysR family transcriptional regulator [Rossellomorea marisflavi]|uniref:LysR family transcriptional regulator n=1 Tax=Rossellomorea marisflavi TaxID=189381 RepID=UPI003FA0D962